MSATGNEKMLNIENKTMGTETKVRTEAETEVRTEAETEIEAGIGTKIETKTEIEFIKVTKSFKKKEVLSSFSLHVKEGERIVLLGANGAGKTTLIRCLLGEYVHEGKILIAGKPPRENRREILRLVGFVPQLPPPLKMPVGALLQFVSSVCEIGSTEMVSIANRLGLDVEKFWNQPFVKLSGGQKQKILIAIAMGRGAKILCLDEPTANLDPSARKILLDLLSQTHSSTTLLISSHRLTEVASLVHRAIELDQGKLVSDEKVISRSEHEIAP